MSIANNISQIKSKLPENVRLVAVSKTMPTEKIIKAYQAGQRIFGENKIQDLTKKYEELPKDIEWHFIGHLQSNKVKYIAPFIHFIHAIDSLKLLKIIDKEARKYNRKIPCLLQVYIAKEETKFGLSEEEIDEILSSDFYTELQSDSQAGVELVGVMGMATYTDNQQQVRSEFKQLKTIFNNLKTKYFAQAPNFKEISMGMSGDFEIAVEEGSTMVRIGTTIFGERN